MNIYKLPSLLRLEPLLPPIAIEGSNFTHNLFLLLLPPPPPFLAETSRLSSFSEPLKATHSLSSNGVWEDEGCGWGCTEEISNGLGDSWESSCEDELWDESGLFRRGHGTSCLRGRYSLGDPVPGGRSGCGSAEGEGEEEGEREDGRGDTGKGGRGGGDLDDLGKGGIGGGVRDVVWVWMWEELSAVARRSGQ